VRFTCSRCGKRYASTDEPVPGRIYAIGCKCGHTIVVKGPDVSGGVRNGAAVVKEDPFAPFHGKYQLPPVEASARSRASAPLRAGGPEGAHLPLPAGDLGRARRVPPAPPAPYDDAAASHGLLLDVDQARALSSGSIATESVSLPPAEDQDQDEVSITFSERLNLPGDDARRPWLFIAATTLALLVLFAGAVAVLSRRPGTVRPAPEEAAAPAPSPATATAPPSPPAASAPEAPLPSPAPPPPAAATPEPIRAPPPVAATARGAPVAPGAEIPTRPPARPRPSRRPASQPAVTEEPASTGPEAASPALLDLMSRKADAPAPAPRPETRGASPGVADVQAAVDRNRSAFDACAQEAGEEAHLAGRQVVLSVTVNPSGIVTSPRLDDAGLDDSAAGVCLKSAARKLVLPAFAGDPVRVRVPLTLGP